MIAIDDVRVQWDANFEAWQTAKSNYEAVAAAHDADYDSAKAEGRNFDPELAAECDKLGNVECAARFELIETTAPDFIAVSVKMDILFGAQNFGTDNDCAPGWNRDLTDAVIADMARLQAEYAGAWVSAWETDGGAALVCPDGKLHLSFPTYELSPRYVAPAEHMDKWFADHFDTTNSQHYHSTMNARVDALKTVPGGVDMVKAYVATKRSKWL